MEVSSNGGTPSHPKLDRLVTFSIETHEFWGSPILGSHQIWSNMYMPNISHRLNHELQTSILSPWQMPRRLRSCHAGRHKEMSRWRSGPGFGMFWLDVDGILMDVYSILFPNICIISHLIYCNMRFWPIPILMINHGILRYSPFSEEAVICPIRV